MATMITAECINCGACDPECPNTAIYQGGVEWTAPDGTTHPALSNDIFYIVPEKCTECVGFFDQEACAAVCPVDCCVPNPEIPEPEAALLARARTLHPDQVIPDDAPSRFRKAEGTAAPAAPVAPAATAPPPVAAGPAAPPPAAARPAPRAVGARVEKALPVRKSQPQPQRSFAGELPVPFEELLERLGPPRRRQGGRGLAILGLLQGVLGALPDTTKRKLERTVGDTRRFSAQMATAANLFLNLVLYPVLVLGGAVAAGRVEFFSDGVHQYLFWGVTAAVLSGMWRVRDNVFRGVPLSEAKLRGAFYGFALIWIPPLLRAALGSRGAESGVAFDGFYDGAHRFDDKVERARRYGEVFALEDRDDAYLFRLEFPRRLPPSSLGTELGLPADMPDYDYEVEVAGGDLLVRGRVTDPQVRKLTSVAPAFPPGFNTRVSLMDPVLGFRQRVRDGVLEVILPKATAH